MAAFEINEKPIKLRMTTVRMTDEERDIVDALVTILGLKGTSDVIRASLAHYVATTSAGTQAIEQVRVAAAARRDRARRVDRKG